MAASALAGAPRIEWLSTVHDFGAFKEEGGLATAIFTYRNTGDEPLVIIGARANCGCTTPRFNTEAVAPGDTATLVVAYDPSGRPGRFSKKVYVDTNTDPRRSTLEIKGTVVGAPSSIAARYPIEVGPMRLAHPAVLLGTLDSGHVKSVLENAYNASTDTLRPVVTNLPKWLEVKAIPETVAPGEQVSLSYFVRSSRIPDWDIVTDTVTVAPFAGSPDALRVPVVVTLNEDFSTLTDKQLATAPVAVIEPRKHNPIIVGDKGASVSFKITNEGKDALKIRRIYTRTDGVTIRYDRDKAIKSGKSSTVTVTIGPAVLGTRPAMSLVLTVITNDPGTPRQTYTLPLTTND